MQTMEGICEDTSRLAVSTMVSIQKSIEFIAKRRMRIAVLVGAARHCNFEVQRDGLHENRKPKLGCELTETSTHNNLIF